MKLLPTLVVVGCLAAGGVYLYRRGKSQVAAGVSRPGVLGTITAGVKGIVAEAGASRPLSSSPASTFTTPTAADGDARTTQTAPTHSRTRMIRLQATATPTTLADRFAQGIN